MDASARHLHHAIISAAARITSGFPPEIIEPDFVDAKYVGGIKAGDYLFNPESELTANKLAFAIKHDFYNRGILKRDEFAQRVMERAESVQIELLARAMSAKSNGTT